MKRRNDEEPKGISVAHYILNPDAKIDDDDVKTVIQVNQHQYHPHPAVKMLIDGQDNS